MQNFYVWMVKAVWRTSFWISCWGVHHFLLSFFFPLVLCFRVFVVYFCVQVLPLKTLNYYILSLPIRKVNAALRWWIKWLYLGIWTDMFINPKTSVRVLPKQVHRNIRELYVPKGHLSCMLSKTTFLFYSRFCTNEYLEFHLMLIFQLDVFHEVTIGSYAIIDLNWFLVLNFLSHRAHGFAIPFVIIFLTSIFYFFLQYICSFCFFSFFSEIKQK